MEKVTKGALVLGGGILVLGLLAAFFVGWRLSAPLRRLMEGVEELRKGNLEHRVQVSSHDELGQLADSFNRLAWSLRESLNKLENLNRNLEKEVGARTEEIRGLAKFVELLNRVRRLDDLAKQATETLARLAGASAAALYLKSGDEFVIQASWGAGSAAFGPARIGGTDPKLKVIKGLGEPKDVAGSWGTDGLSVALGQRVVGLVAVPVVYGESLEGVLLLAFTTDTKSVHKEVLRQAAGQLGIAVANVRAFEAAEQLAAELEKRNEALRRHRDVLQKQKEKLEESNRLKSEFLANTTHELRTPLNAIIGYAQLILEGAYGPVNQEQKEALEAIDESAQNLLDLINQTLDYAKLEAGQMPVVVTEVDLDELCRAAVRSASSLTRQRPYDIEYRGPGRPLVLATDEAKVRQILINFLSNAVKFTPSGSVVVVLEPSADGGAVISVRDTGPGIAPADQEVIFEAFRQLDGSSTRQVGGTGLGLAICRSLAQLLGARIGLESTPGKGSTFSLHLPAQPPARAIAADQAPADDLSATLGVASTAPGQEADLSLGELMAEGREMDGEVGCQDGGDELELDRFGMDLVDLTGENRTPGPD